MRRRRFVVGVAATAGGAALTLGSGAFTSVDAERSISVTTAPDADAFLELRPIGDGFRSGSSGNLVEFHIPGLLEDEFPEENPTDPEGLGVDSVYRFGRDADPDSEPGLFKARNRGTKPVKIFGESHPTQAEPAVRIFDVETGELLTEQNKSEPLEPGGEPLRLGLEIDTHGVATGEYEVTVLISTRFEDE